MNKYFLHLSMLLLLNVMSSVELSAGAKPEKIKNIILIIGDGMGPGQIGLLEAYARQSSNPVITNRKTAFSRMLNEGGVLGVSMTYAAQSLTTDSAASATQLALGAAANPETVGIDARGDSQHPNGRRPGGHCPDRRFFARLGCACGNGADSDHR